MLIDKKYLILPVSYHAAKKKVHFYENDDLVFDLDVSLDIKTPDHVYKYDVRRFLGRDLDIRCEEVDSFLPQLTDDGEAPAYDEKFRPSVRFTAPGGWINDPNGMFYLNGEYHLFYQHNPVLNKWGNMHWGHAVSLDLFHWEHKGEALFPDETGTMFSGSGIVDKDNCSGLMQGDVPPILLFYTAAGGGSAVSSGKPFTQCMAYSTDGGKTFNKYENNPIVEHIEAENRDPKVVWCEDIGAYIMAIYLADNRYMLLKSDNLLEFKSIQSFPLFGDAECPDIYCLPIDGDSKKRAWVFSGASDVYFVGKFSGRKFMPDGEAKRLHYGKNSYAAQTFSGVPAGRIIRMAWNTSDIPNMPFNGSMCVPCDMSVKTIDSQLHLCAYPVEEIKNTYDSEKKFDVAQGDGLCCKLERKAQDILVSARAAESGRISIKLYGQEITADCKENEIMLGSSSMPLCVTDSGEIKIRIIADVNGAEIFAGYGQAHMCVGFLSDYCLDKLIVSPSGLSEVSVKVAQLKDVH